MRKILFCIALLSGAVCASQTIKFSGANVTTRGSDEPDSFCQNFNLTNQEVLTFFTRAKEVSAKEIHDQYDYLPCYVKGTIALKDSSSTLRGCTFHIRGGGTAELACDNEEIKLYVCKTCNNLFKVEL
ncbi:MAG: hypothetical protein V4660_16650 [Pseudomonadota bacterium]